MKKDVLKVRLTHNVRQLKKYVDEAIEKGAENITFDMDEENPYFIFSVNFTIEQENEYEINKLIKDSCEKLELLQRKKYKTYSFRTERYGLCGKDMENLIEKFRLTNSIKDCLSPKIEQVITAEYDDFDEDKQTIFITEVLVK